MERAAKCFEFYVSWLCPNFSLISPPIRFNNKNLLRHHKHLELMEGEGRKNGTVRRVAQYAGLYVLVVLCWPLCLSGCDSIWFAVAILPILGQIV
jgi:hypothetical protein